MTNLKDRNSSAVLLNCNKVNIDFRLMSAIIEIESHWDTYAVKYEPNFDLLNKPEIFAHMLGITAITEHMLQHFSFGLGQLMGASARDLGMRDSLLSLCVPEIGSYWAALHMKKICDKYSFLPDRISAYNEGTPKKKEDGSYLDQDYVDDVLKVFNANPA
jgi:hypothetical protein